ncbi:metalloregulator ArsR/SmtB family transcription factor [Nocardia sp. NPDC048505]|uniref:ArsR/SmtB family transcription factor n=1 Tax=unclassified Nocardia TaxID=2637762 RepID=UPI0033FD11B5
MARDVFEVLADPTRRRILDLLRDGERTVGELAGALGTAQPNVSKHLRMLGTAELVRIRVDGPRRHYGLAPARLRDIDRWLAPFREIWADRLDDLERYLDTMPDNPEE